LVKERTFGLLQPSYSTGTGVGSRTAVFSCGFSAVT